MKILALSPHPDDAELGAGGFLLDALDKGAELDIVYCYREKQAEVEQNSKQYGYHAMWLTNTSQRPKPISDYVKILDNILYNKPYTHFFIPHGGESHQDHKTVASLAQASARRFRGMILQYEVVAYSNNNHNFRPNLFFGIDDHITEKLAWADSYKDVTPKMISATKALAGYRGINTDSSYAEAFEILRWSDYLI
jgi:LmbE family N-acetylglucosaminyl deacetylase